LNNAKKNYTTIEREALTMVYVLQFKHYLLGNKFVFYVDHMALLYLIKKFQLLGQIVRWLLLFLEYDFSGGVQTKAFSFNGGCCLATSRCYRKSKGA
jgi:hypothetical protein